MKQLWKIFFIVVGIAALIGVNWALFSGVLLGIPDEVEAALLSDDKVRVENWENKESYIFMPVENKPATGLILYPEGNL
ncbi:MAG: hypothetical protein ACK2T5_15385, partial [Anaerolineales bacterium]